MGADFIGCIALLAAVAFVLLELNRNRSRHSSPDAERKGMQLLLANLSQDQRWQYDAFGYFDVVGSVTGKTYRIYHGSYRNVVELQRPWALFHAERRSGRRRLHARAKNRDRELRR
jgi:hypothetical protein